MKTILCYGDSNTWGYDPATGERFGPGARWPGVLARELGDGYAVIEEGLNGRTTVWDDPIDPHRNGREYLVPCLESHAPLDLVAIALGVNDLKARLALSASDIADGAGALVETAQKSATGPDGGPPAVLLVAPPPVGDLGEADEMFEGALEKSRRFSLHYRRVADKYGCGLLDLAGIVSASALDGVHFEASEHAKIGREAASRVKDLLR
ncbi:hydrolase [Rubrobacter marinus]|uniref:Hydrolase n=1 Tax=Rubrobacter marinus TaxID=2653852 RepID=A0A6G8PWM8_9ACTN|nr:SGNH/GDSL hydrolase family protein [Rubrobacter marinus]QIN78585.1 hydrolase [Rubrobacter marinus]